MNLFDSGKPCKGPVPMCSNRYGVLINPKNYVFQNRNVNENKVA